MSTALVLAAARSDDLPTIEEALIQWLIDEHGAFKGYGEGSIDFGFGDDTPVLKSAATATIPFSLQLPSDVGARNMQCRVWYFLDRSLDDPPIDDATVTAILRVFCLTDARPPHDGDFWHPHPGAPPRSNLLDSRIAKVFREWFRIKDRLPAYLDQRRALIDVHCPLISPLRALTYDYDKPTTTEELWATGLGDE
jgi:hypothetical protein